MLSSASLQSPLLQALLLQGGERFFIPFVIQQGKGRSWAVKEILADITLPMQGSGEGPGCT